MDKPAINYAEFRSKGEWREWLRQNHSKCRALWLVFRKGKCKPIGLTYDDALREAICFGWIDSIIKKTDDEKYARKFTPRTDSENWSAKNTAILSELVEARKMTTHGLQKVGPDVLTSNAKKKPAIVLDKALEQEIQRNNKAWNYFATLSPSHKRRYIGWIMSAKKQETRDRRAREAIAMLERGLPLGLK